jgi:hypothetical protein
MLGPELPINFDSVKDEIEALQKRVDADRKFKPEELVRAASEFWLNAQNGLNGGLKGLGQGVSDTFFKLERGLHGYSADAEAAMEREAAKTNGAGTPYPPLDSSGIAAPTGHDGGGGGHGGHGGDGGGVGGGSQRGGRRDPQGAATATAAEAEERDNVMGGGVGRQPNVGGYELRHGSSFVQELMDTGAGGIYMPTPAAGGGMARREGRPAEKVALLNANAKTKRLARSASPRASSSRI